MSEIPERVKRGLTTRQWKAKKRKEIKDVKKALRKYRSGCFYCPEYDTFLRFEDLLDSIISAHSVKKWGR